MFQIRFFEPERKNLGSFLGKESLYSMEILRVEVPDGCVLIPVEDCFAIVDESDYHLVSGRRWKLEYGYARADGRVRKMMHQIIFGEVQKSMVIDHVNGNRLDNRRSNLRLVTRSANSHRRSKKPVSGYHGVSQSTRGGYGRGPKRNQWRATIHKDGRTHYLGSYLSAEEAARAYNLAAKALYGEHATLNEGV